MPNVFISYRREDSALAARGLCFALTSHLGEDRVFMDVDTIRPGDDFVEAIETAVGQCDVLIAMIGPKWTQICDESGLRRLDDPDDFVRLEIATALRRNIRVIPVLTEGARMPRTNELPEEIAKLARRQALEVTQKSFRSDASTLIELLDSVCQSAGQDSVEAQPPIVARAAPAPAPGLGSSEPAASATITTPDGRQESSVKTDVPDVPAAAARSSTSRASSPAAGQSSVQTVVRAKTPLEAADFGMRVDVIFDREAYNSSEDPLAHFLVELEFNPPQRNLLEEVPNDIGLVLDVSGSMRKENRFELLTEAVGEFLRRLPAKDRATIVLFSTDACVASDFVRGEEARNQVERVLREIKSSPILFGKKTNLAPALMHMVTMFERQAARPQAVKRIYVLTDGTLHDMQASAGVLSRIRDHRAEIGIYGFGTQLDPARLKVLLRGQYGGWVKPIVKKPEIVDTFALLSDRSRALVTREARLIIAFDQRVTPGDAWLFRPYSRYSGQIRKRQFTCDVGPVEIGRVYSLMLEVRLPPDEKPVTPVALIRALWRDGEHVLEQRAVAKAAREPKELINRGDELELGLDPYPLEHIEGMNRTCQAFLMLDALRNRDNLQSQLFARRAELVIARQEGRSATKLEAIQNEIRRLEESTLGDEEFRLAPRSPEEEMLLEADEGSQVIAVEDSEAFSEAGKTELDAIELSLGARATDELDGNIEDEQELEDIDDIWRDSKDSPG